MDQQGVHGIFSKVATQYPSHVALDQGSGRVVSYRELEDESNRLANFLIASGAQPGSIVAIMVREPARVVTALLSILKARCAFAPFEARIPDNRLHVMAEQITPAWVIVDSDHLGKAAEIVSGLNARVNTICLDGDEFSDYTINTNPGVKS